MCSKTEAVFLVLYVFSVEANINTRMSQNGIVVRYEGIKLIGTDFNRSISTH